MPDRVLIAGVSTRALAASAARAGYEVTAIDAFADLDLCEVAEAISLGPGRRYSPMAAAARAAFLPGGVAAYTSNFENYPLAVARLANHRQLLGNPPAVLARVRDPIALMRRLHLLGFAVPRTRTTRPAGRQGKGAWLRKPRRSGGGHGTSVWRVAERVPRSHYLQERIAGVAGSVLFAADGRRSVMLGLSRQLVGDRQFGVGGFRYCGSLIGPPAALFPGQPELGEIAASLSRAVADEFQLIGVNGIDFIARDGVPYPIEVNPRYCASMELIERAQDISIFALHAQASRGELPNPPDVARQVHGKAIVFARRNVTMGDTRSWLERDVLADIPHPGEKISQGRPICTVFARAKDAGECYQLLCKRAAAVYRAVESRKRRAA
jgi:uncharacterized protein